MQVPNGTGPGVRKSKRPLLASRTRCNILWKPPKFCNKVKIVESKDCMKSASYEYRKMSARSGAQFVPIGMPTICWKTFPAKTTKILSTRNSSILMKSSSEYLFLESECSFTKYVYSCPNTKDFYRRLPFLKMKAFWMILVSLSFNFWRGMVVKKWKNQKTWCLLHGWKLEIFKRCSSNSFEFLRIHIWLIPLLE